MIDAQAEHGGSWITCVHRDGDGDYGRYGYVAGNEVSPDWSTSPPFIESLAAAKTRRPIWPASADTYSTYNPGISPETGRNPRSQRRRIYDQDAMQQMINDGHHIYAATSKTASTTIQATAGIPSKPFSILRWSVTTLVAS